MTHQIVDRTTWIEARRELLAAEKQHTRERDALAARRRALPWVAVLDEYVFADAGGPVSLLDLFAGKRQLLVYHFMFGPNWDEGCPSCSFWADGFDRMTVHLAARNTSLVAASSASVEQLHDYRSRMGWSFRWISTANTSFNFDYAVSGTDEYNYATVDGPIGESPGLSSFVRRGDSVYHTYSAYARGLDAFNPGYQLLDLTAFGRDERELAWSMAWLRRRDQYDLPETYPA